MEYHFKNRTAAQSQCAAVISPKFHFSKGGLFNFLFILIYAFGHEWFEKFEKNTPIST